MPFWPGRAAGRRWTKRSSWRGFCGWGRWRRSTRRSSRWTSTLSSPARIEPPRSSSTPGCDSPPRRVDPGGVFPHNAGREIPVKIRATTVLCVRHRGKVAMGAGGPCAVAAARALARKTDLGAREIVEEALKIAAEIDVYTNDRIVVEEL